MSGRGNRIVKDGAVNDGAAKDRNATCGWAVAPALLALSLALSAPYAFAQEKPSSEPAQETERRVKVVIDTPNMVLLPEAEQFFVHEFHATQLALDCSVCHVPVEENSTVMGRPGHEQCEVCHQDDYESDLTPRFCGQCHSTFPPFSNEDLVPFPFFKKKRAILFDFSHNLHVDPGARVDGKTGFRADCTFCHQFDLQGVFASFPSHPQCTSCHQNENIAPNLTPQSDTADCRGCHNPEEIENPGFTKERVMIADHVVSGVHVNLRFSHVAHFKVKDKYNLDCTTCHHAIPQSTSLADLTLPQMLDCVECHDTDKGLEAEFRMSNCSNCHVDTQVGSLPASHSKAVKPLFHTESFRIDHEVQAVETGAKCYVCHTNVSPAASAETQCASCHEVMRPESHTARWRDDIHGKHAALDRTTCATCHTADTCIRCHNLLPRSHAPLGPFKAGAHAGLAMLEQRSCFTCHTFEDTCSQCHRR